MLFALALGTALGTAHAHDCAPAETDPTALGSGTPTDPWQLCTVAQLAELEAYPAGHFELVADIDIESLTGGLGFYCSLFPTNGGFEGSFNGNGHTLFNLRAERGLFTCIHGGVVEDLHLEDVEVENGTNQYGVGGLFGFLRYGRVSGVTVTGTIIHSGSATGGIGGSTYDSQLERVSFDGEVQARNNSGGIVGIVVRSDITDCAAIGDVEGLVNIGGLVGTWTTVTGGSHLRRCVAAMSVSDLGLVEDPRVGLLVGLDQGAILGSDGEDGWDLVFALASGDTPLIGSRPTPLGAAIAADRAVLLDPTSYERAGWDLETVWTEPTRTSLPQLR